MRKKIVREVLEMATRSNRAKLDEPYFGVQSILYGVTDQIIDKIFLVSLHLQEICSFVYGR